MSNNNIKRANRLYRRNRGALRRDHMEWFREGLNKDFNL